MSVGAGDPSLPICPIGYSSLDDVFDSNSIYVMVNGTQILNISCHINLSVRTGLYVFLLLLSAILLLCMGMAMIRMKIRGLSTEEWRPIKRTVMQMLPHHVGIVVSCAYILIYGVRWVQSMTLIVILSLTVVFGIMSHSAYLFEVLKLSLQTRCAVFRQEEWSHSDRVFTVFVIITNCILGLSWTTILFHLYTNVMYSEGYGTFASIGDGTIWISCLWASVTVVVWSWSIGFALYGYSIIHSIQYNLTPSEDIIKPIRKFIFFFSFALFSIGCGGLLLAFIPWMQERSCYFYCIMGSVLTSVDFFRLHRRCSQYYPACLLKRNTAVLPLSDT